MSKLLDWLRRWRAYRAQKAEEEYAWRFARRYGGYSPHPGVRVDESVFPLGRSRVQREQEQQG